MRNGAEFPQIEIPTVVFQIETIGDHAILEKVMAFLALRSANDLPHSGHENIHRGHRFAIIIGPHVEGLDRFWVVVNGERALHHFLTEIALVLGLQVHAPLHGIVELLARLQQLLDGLGISHTTKTA